MNSLNFLIRCLTIISDPINFSFPLLSTIFSFINGLPASHDFFFCDTYSFLFDFTQDFSQSNQKSIILLLHPNRDFVAEEAIRYYIAAVCQFYVTQL